MPFAGDITATANGTLLFSVAAALLYGAMVHQPASWRRTVVKTLSVALLALLAWSQDGPLLLVLALAASAAGDAALAAEDESWFLPGLVAFLVAHLLYVALFATGGQGFDLVASDMLRGVWAGLILIAAIMLVARLLPAVPNGMRPPVVVYALAITAMGVAALTWRGYALAVGATLFIMSDALLAARKYLIAAGSAHQFWSGYAVWALYYAAQMAIALVILL